MTASNPERVADVVQPVAAGELDLDAIEYWAREEGDGATVAQTIAMCEQIRTLLAALGSPAAWATVLPSGKIHAMRTKESDAQRRTAAWNTDHPRPPLAATVPLALLAAPVPASPLAGGQFADTRHPRHPDTVLLDWLEQYGNVNFDFETGQVRFPLPESFRAADTLREIFRTARAHQERAEQEGDAV